MEDGFLLLAMMEIQVGLDDFKCQSEDEKNNEVCEVYKSETAHRRFWGLLQSYTILSSLKHIQYRKELNDSEKEMMKLAIS